MRLYISICTLYDRTHQVKLVAEKIGPDRPRQNRDADGSSGNGLEQRLWVQQDANWNVTALVNGAGTVLERFVYDSFGSVTVLDGNWNTLSGSAYVWTYLFQGLPIDWETGLYHARYRDLHAELGRPLQRDPLGFAAGDVNLYRWEGNNAPNVTDPLGLTWVPPPDETAGWTDVEWNNHWNRLRGPGPAKFNSGTWSRNWFERRIDGIVDAISGPTYVSPPGFGESLIPVWGDLREAAHYNSTGNYWMMMLHTTLAAADIATLGGASVIKAGIKGGIKAGIKESGEKLIKEGAEEICEKGAEKGAKEAAEGTGKKGIGCFAAGTPVRTPHGERLIEELVRGDVVLSRHEDDATAPVQSRIVEEVYRRTAPVLSITIGGQEIRLTEEHPFYTLSEGWIEAYKLRAGDWVLSERGDWLPIAKVEPAGDPVVVYNMTVANAHTFFVGRERWGWSVWVHNVGPHDCTPGSSNPKSAAELEREANISAGIPESLLGPSGKPKIHAVDHPSRKKAKDAARADGKGKPIHDPNDKGQPPHFHAIGPDGKKIGKQSPHHN